MADFVTTTTHKTLRGPRSGMVLCKEKFAKDVDKTVFPGLQGGPLMHIIAAKAVCFHEALQPSYREYAKQIVANAKTLSETLMAGGITLASGGTDNHLMLCDVTSIGLSGKIAEHALDKAGITVNKNMIPYDQRKPLDPSGIRIGTPALTTRGDEGSRNEEGRAPGSSKPSRRPTTLRSLRRSAWRSPNSPGPSRSPASSRIAAGPVTRR